MRVVPVRSNGSRAVEADGCHLGGVVGQEEVAVDGGKEYQQHQGRHTHGQSDGEERLGGGGLREEHDAEQEQRDGEEQGIGGEDALYAAQDDVVVTLEEGAAHPGDAEDGDHGVHARGKDVAAGGLAHVGLAHQQDEGGYAHHDHFDGGTHVERLAVKGGPTFGEDA